MGWLWESGGFRTPSELKKALVIAGLDWQISRRSVEMVQVEGFSRFVSVHGWDVLLREGSQQEVLGFISSLARRETVDHQDVFKLVDRLGTWLAMGTFQDGRICWGLLELGNGLFEHLRDEAIVPWLLVTVDTAQVKVGFKLLLAQDCAVVKDVLLSSDQIEAEVLAEVQKFLAEYSLLKMRSWPRSEGAELRQYIHDTYEPLGGVGKTSAERVTSMISAQYFSPHGDGGSLWRAYQAICWYLDWEQGTPGKQVNIKVARKRLASSWVGRGSRVRGEAWKQIIKRV